MNSARLADSASRRSSRPVRPLTSSLSRSLTRCIGMQPVPMSFSSTRFRSGVLRKTAGGLP
eukprot:10194197-Alexandrium_andersonii.AAC.1